MHFESLEIEGAGVVSLDRLSDSRGFFARTFCEEEFEEFGLPSTFVQSSISFNYKKGTLRGMHFQWPPSNESKLVRCTRGRIHDVLLDLRPQSATYRIHEAVILDADSRNAVFVPSGVAHGFQTLENDTEVLYQMSDVFRPELSAGFRWDDSAFGITWPLSDIVMSDRDRDCPDFDQELFEQELRRRAMQGGKSA